MTTNFGSANAGNWHRAVSAQGWIERPSRVWKPFHTPVRGCTFAARPADAKLPGRGQAVVLHREPDHLIDPLAVALWVPAPWWRLGYLERAVAARIAPRLDRGERLRAWVSGWRPRLDGGSRPYVLIAPDAVARSSAREDRLNGQQQVVGEQSLEHVVVEDSE